MSSARLRKVIIAIVVVLLLGSGIVGSSLETPTVAELVNEAPAAVSVPAVLSKLEVKGRAPKTGYKRDNFGDGWQNSLGCDTRNRILARDLTDETLDQAGCKVLTGTLNDPYTGATVMFVRGETTSDDIQIDHVVALSNAWQTGAQQLSYQRRVEMANDPINLLAVDGLTNEQKSDGDAATWLPPNKMFRCQYVNLQISVKTKYDLWVTEAERTAMATVLAKC